MIINPALFGATIRAWDNGADLQTDNMILLTKRACAKAKDRHPHGVRKSRGHSSTFAASTRVFGAVTSSAQANKSIRCLTMALDCGGAGVQRHTCSSRIPLCVSKHTNKPPRNVTYMSGPVQITNMKHVMYPQLVRHCHDVLTRT